MTSEKPPIRKAPEFKIRAKGWEDVFRQLESINEKMDRFERSLKAYQDERKSRV
jgi:hypothetical protein